MQKGSVLGYDLNEKNCQISYYDENKEEPETMEAAVDNYQIPLILGYYKERWVYGQEAKRLREAGEGDIVTHLFRKAVKRKKVRVGGKIHDGVWLLAKFISMTLKKFEQIDYITFSVPYTNVDMSKMLKGIGKYIGVPGECVFVQDYKESFCQYMFYQPKELWQYESALFYCDAAGNPCIYAAPPEYSKHQEQGYVCDSRRSRQCAHERTGSNLSCVECR